MYSGTWSRFAKQPSGDGLGIPGNKGINIQWNSMNIWELEEKTNCMLAMTTHYRYNTHTASSQWNILVYPSVHIHVQMRLQRINQITSGMVLIWCWLLRYMCIDSCWLIIINMPYNMTSLNTAVLKSTLRPIPGTILQHLRLLTNHGIPMLMVFKLKPVYPWDDWTRYSHNFGHTAYKHKFIKRLYI